MGGGISLAPITEEILESDAARAYDPEGLSRTQLSLSKDVLQSIRRRSYTDPSFRRRRSSTSSLKNRLTLLPKYEVPAHVNAFLEKIGIDDPARTGLNASSTHGAAVAAALPSTSSILPASLTSSRRSGSVSGAGASGGVAAAATGRRISTHIAPAYSAAPTPAAGASTSGKDGAAPAENDRTTKLVRHIFECLGALQVSPCPHRDSSK